ncbi:hypothetical protein Tco_1549253 [Tanacetum coccineum]
MHELFRCAFMHLPDVSTNQQEFTQEGRSNPDDEVNRHQINVHERAYDAENSDDQMSLHPGPEPPPEFQRSWCVEGYVRSIVISSVLMQRRRGTKLRRKQFELNIYHR